MKLSILKFLLVSILFCWIPKDHFGQKYPFVTYNFKNGFNRSSVNSEMQDSRGVLWFTSESGVVSYNGSQFNYFTSLKGFTDGPSSAIDEGADHLLWMTSKKDVYYYDGVKFELVNSDSSETTSCLDIKYDSIRNYVWVGKENGVFFVDLNQSKDEWVLKKASFDNPTLNNNLILDVFLDREGRLWFSGTEGSVAVEESEDTAVAFLDAGKKSFKIFSMINRFDLAYMHEKIDQDVDGNYLISTWGGGCYLLEKDFNPNSFSSYLHEYSVRRELLPNDRIWFFKEQKSNPGTYWIGTDGFGLIKVELDSNFNFIPSSYKNYSTLNGLPNNHITALMEDHENNLWFSTLKGISRFTGSGFATYTNEDGLVETNILALSKDNKNELWIGTWGGGLIHFTGKSFTQYSWDELISESKVVDVNTSPFGDIYASCSGGGVSILPRKDVDDPLKKAKFLPAILSIDEFPITNAKIGFNELDSSMWAFSSIYGFVKYKVRPGGQHDKLYDLLIYEENVVCNKIWTDPVGNGWFFTNHGIYILDPTLRRNKLIHLDKAHRLNCNIIDMNIGPDGNMWLATSGNGIIKIDGERIKNTQSIKPEDIIFWSVENDLDIYETTSIVKKDHYMLVGTPTGLRKIDLEKDSILFVDTYMLEDGFWGFQCSNRGIIEYTPGNFFVSTSNGLTKVIPEKIIKNTTSPLLHISNIRINYEDVDWTSLEQSGGAQFTSKSDWFNIPRDLVLSYQQNHLTFDFMAVAFHKNDMVRYQFKLEGYDENWNPETKDRKATYANLAPGKYTFKVKAANFNGIWSDVLEYPFEIKAPFWQTTAFILTVIAVAGFIIFWIFKFRTRALKRRNLELEEKVNRRTEQISSQNKELATKNKEITDSIEYAKNIQQGILPDTSLYTKYFTDGFVFFKPKDIVSGDFYWAFEDNEYFFFAVVDCTGHGVPGAFVSIVANDELKKAVSASITKDPSDILNRLNELIDEAFRNNDNTGVKDGMDLALCALNKNTGEVKFAGAYNPMWVINQDETIPSNHTETIKHSRFGNYFLHEISGTKQPIGKFEHRSNFQQTSVQLKKGDTLYLFSDGFQDQFGGEKGKKFKKHNFKMLLTESQKIGMNDQEKLLDASLNAWKGDREQVDDICVLGLRY
jgi:serine phosphatase RsbU (regulator of sigma subunit)/ligand-binding sensor domain-containing protein